MHLPSTLPTALLAATLLALPAAARPDGEAGPPPSPPHERHEDAGHPRGHGPDHNRDPNRRGGRDDRGDRGRGGFERPDREEVAAVLRDIDPALAEEAAERTRRAGGRPERDGRLRELLPRVIRLTHLKKTDRPLYDLRVRDIRLDRDTEALVTEAQRVRGDATIEDADDRLEDLGEELEDKVETHFELRQEIRAAELERLERRLEALQEDLDRREDDKKQLIAQRLAELRGTDGAW